MAHKRQNPAYEPGIDPDAWILAARCNREDISFSETRNLAKKIEAQSGKLLVAYNTENYRRELSHRAADKTTTMRRRIYDRIPIRPTLNQVPFFLRPSYTPENSFKPSPTYLPDRNYAGLVKASDEYEPICQMKAKLHEARYYIMRKFMDGLIRWPETIHSARCEFVVTPSFKEFSFKIHTHRDGNSLHTSKIWDSIYIVARAPLAFFNQAFWGLGSHLVVQVTDMYQTEGGEITVIRTLSCDREDLYLLDQPNVLKDRYYVEKGSQRGTGLTEQAAIRSMQYFMGKSITAALSGH